MPEARVAAAPRGVGSGIRLRMLLLLASAASGILALLLLDAWAGQRDARMLAELDAGPRASIALLTALTAVYAQELPAALAQAPTGAERQRAVRALLRRADQDWRALLALASDPARRELLLQLSEARTEAEARLQAAVALDPAEDVAAPVAWAEPVLRRLRLLLDHEQRRIDAAIDQRQAQAHRDAWLRWVIGALGLSLVLGLGLRLAWNLVRGIETLEQQALRLGERDFRPYPIEAARGELGAVARAFDEMRAELLRYGRELQLSEQRANLANRAKSRFLATMSHELRTPMVGITGMIEVLAHTALDAEQRRALALVRHSADGLLQIVGDVLDFSRIEAGRLELAPLPTDLPRLLSRCGEHFRVAALSKGLSLDWQLDPTLAEAHLLDPMRLRQVLSNLLSNAIKFTERGHVTLRAEVLEDGVDRQRVRLSVSDTGIGIAPEQQPALFDAFAQAGADVPHRYGGSGLGLAICARLAELMGSRIVLDSRLGAGSCFSLELALPRASQAAVAAEPELPGPLPVVAVSEGTTAEAGLGPVLLVDDHPTNREVVGRLLALVGIRSEAVADAQAALAAWRARRHPLVLTDLNMPGLDGFGLVRALRAEEAAAGLARTPVLALTASMQKGEAERCIEAGMDDCLSKPVAAAELARRLRPWLAPREGEPERAPIGPTAPVAASEAVRQEFLASCAEDLAAALLALDQPEALARQAHRLRGACRWVGADGIEAAALALETAAHSAQGERLRALQAVATALAAFARAPVAPDAGA